MDTMNRMPPLMPAGAYKTFSVAAPRNTHFRKAACAEVGCDGYTKGWQSAIDETTQLGQGQAQYIRRDSGRKFAESRLPDGRTLFAFEAGQRCFRSAETSHMVRLDRPEIYVVRDGDWRGNPRGTEPRQHTRPELWVEDFGEHQDRLMARLQRG